MINEGDKAPALKVTSSDGSTVDLSAPGQPLVLYFYPKDDTSGCTLEAQNFTQLAPEFNVISKYDLAVPLASDEDGRISDAFGTWVEKSMYGRKYMGMERATYLIGADGTVLKAWRKVKVPKHAEEVLKAARETASA